MNIKKLISFIAIAFLPIITIVSQTTEIVIQGTVKHLETNLEDINVFNKTKNLGTSSDANGQFQIPVTLGDSILFSSVQFQNRTIVVFESHIEKKSMEVFLEPELNELEVVELQQKIRLEWQKISVPRGTVLEMDELSSRTPNAEFFTDPTKMSGVNFMNIIHGLTKNIRSKKREKKKRQEQISSLKKEFPQKLKLDFGNTFFTDHLGLETAEIDLYLDYFESKGLLELYEANDFEIKNFLIKQNKIFKAMNKSE